MLFEATAFKIVCGAGAALAVASAEGTEPSAIEGKLSPAIINGQPGLDGQVSFNGLSISYMSYVWVAVEDAANKLDMHKNGAGSKYEEEPSENLFKNVKLQEESTKAFVLLKPRAWPEKPIELSNEQDT